MRRTIFLLAGALTLGACANDAVDRETQEVTSTGFGEQAYNDYCAGCHNDWQQTRTKLPPRKKLTS